MNVNIQHSILHIFSPNQQLSLETVPRGAHLHVVHAFQRHRSLLNRWTKMFKPVLSSQTFRWAQSFIFFFFITHGTEVNIHVHAGRLIHRVNSCGSKNLYISKLDKVQNLNLLNQPSAWHLGVFPLLSGNGPKSPLTLINRTILPRLNIPASSLSCSSLSLLPQGLCTCYAHLQSFPLTPSLSPD